MEKSITKKVAGGKLFRLDISYDMKIDAVKLTGDFFLHPEDFIYEIEDSLVGLDVKSSAGQILDEMNDKLYDKKFDLIGVSFEDIVNALYELINGPKEEENE